VVIAPGTLIAVTGGTGAVGRRVVRDLVGSGFHVRSLSRTAVADAEHVPVDLATDEPVGAELLSGCSAVVHLASHIPRKPEDPASAELCLRINAIGTLKLLQASEEAGIGRFIQTTSANAYAPGLEAPREEDAMYPSERGVFYLSSKVVQDVLGSYWANRRAMVVTTLRLSSVYGAGAETSLFTRFARALHAGDPITLANGGSFGADFVDIADVSSAIVRFLTADAAGVFNIASGERTTLLQAARLLIELIGSAEDRLIVEPERETEAGFPRMDISKALDFGFAPSDLRTGLGRLVEWVSGKVAP
jgi:UDP-glucose 4-epimerase